MVRWDGHGLANLRARRGGFKFVQTGSADLDRDPLAEFCVATVQPQPEKNRVTRKILSFYAKYCLDAAAAVAQAAFLKKCQCKRARRIVEEMLCNFTESFKRAQTRNHHPTFCKIKKG